METEIVQAQDPWDGTADISWYSGDSAVFNITTAQQLAGLAQLVNNGNAFEGKKINLCNDIFLNDESYQNIWIPIACDGKVFQGTFNGNKHAIYNMLTDSDNDGGLFGKIGEKGLVKCVNISQGRLFSGGCIADTNEGIISFCNNASGTGSSQDIVVGGICNYNYNLVYGCKNYGEVWGEDAGGIVGRNMKGSSTISQCSNHGLVGAKKEAAGIVHYNFGWLYNCYNKGVISNLYVDYSGNHYGKADCLNGIVDYSSGHVENCYSTGKFSYGEVPAGCYAICQYYNDNGINNCYALSLAKQNNQEATIVSYNEMIQQDFIGKIDQQNHSVFSVWMKDDININDGLPITAADYSYYTGQCKIQPEAWITGGNKPIEAKLEDKVCVFSLQCYFNESEPVVTIENPGIAEISGKSGTITLKKAGTTQINIHFDETENCSSADYQLALKVVAGSGTNQQTVSNTNAKTPLSKAVVTLSANTYNYDGKAKKPAVKSVKLGGKTLSSGTDYTVSYTNNKNIGTATVTITGKGNYTDIAKKTFKITAKKGSKFTVGAYKYKITSGSAVAFSGLKSAKTTKVTIPKTVKIGGKNFKVTVLEAKALHNKKKVTSVTIGANITAIGKNAFASCSKLGVVTIKSTRLKTVGKNAFKGIKATAKIKVPAKKLSAYKKLLKGKGQGKKVKITKK